MKYYKTDNCKPHIMLAANCLLKPSIKIFLNQFISLQQMTFSNKKILKAGFQLGHNKFKRNGLANKIGFTASALNQMLYPLKSKL
jgi:hypothetical protein